MIPEMRGIFMSVEILLKRYKELKPMHLKNKEEFKQW